MNIFVLDANPITAARFHNDRHCVKMILESCQLLLLAHSVLDRAAPIGVTLRTTHLRAHTQHPCALWARASTANYRWLHSLARALCMEFEARYGHPHSYAATNVPALDALPVVLRTGPLTPHPQCMPEHCKVAGDAVAAYRSYYIREKRDLAVWYRGDESKVPSWYKLKEAA